MIQMRFRSNLDDVMRYETFPKELPCAPQVGDYIQSKYVWNNNNVKDVQLELRVVRISYEYIINEWQLFIELHLPTNIFVSISHFESYYKYIRGIISAEKYTMEANRAYKLACAIHDDIFLRDIGAQRRYRKMQVVKCHDNFIEVKVSALKNSNGAYVDIDRDTIQDFYDDSAIIKIHKDDIYNWEEVYAKYQNM